MSRKGKAPIPLPKEVDAKISEGEISIKGPKGQLSQRIGKEVDVVVDDDAIIVMLKEEYRDKSNLHGLYRSLINNMVVGTTTGFEKRLKLIGVGYRAMVQGDALDLQLGFSHPTKLTIPRGIEIKVEKNIVIVSGVDKQQVGQFSAEIRSLRPPEPYQGKGVRYENEYVRAKAGKAATKK